MIAAEPDLGRAIRDEESRLLREFAEPLGGDLVRDEFRAALDALMPARVRRYVPLLAYRIARDRLRRRRHRGRGGRATSAGTGTAL